MCRFVAYLGEPVSLDLLLLKPSNSLVHQSLDAKEFRLRVNGDGFGVAWYTELRPEPVRVRTLTPAWSNQNLRSFAPVALSGCIVAHVRAASPGLPVTETNCHPFVHGPFTFCHNGSVGDFAARRQGLLAGLAPEAFAAIEGTTDSEVLFAMFLEEIAKPGTEDRGHDLAVALARTIDRVKHHDGEPSYLNLCVTDGQRVAATRFSTDPDGNMSSLYTHHGKRYDCVDGVCRMVDPGGGLTTAIIASEPLSTDDGWEPVPPNHVGVIREDRTASSWSL
ncbi:MAG: class II glutamine amidotransferase [Planctomycetota bacterium]